MDPADVALRDALLAALREHHAVMSAEQLAPLMPRRVMLMQHTPPSFCVNHHAGLSRHPEIHLLECRGSEHLVSRLPMPSVVLHHLTRLHTDGFVQRFVLAGPEVGWMWIEPEQMPHRAAEAAVRSDFASLVATLQGGEV